MTVITTSKLEGLRALQESLDAMLTRLRALSEAPALDEDEFIEITAIYNNVAYAFLYLNANEEYDQVEQIAPWQSAFYEDADLDARLLTLLDALHCTDPEAEDSRQVFVTSLHDKQAGTGTQAATALDALLAQASAILRDTDADRAALLRRLGVDPGTNPSMVFYKILGNTADPAMRRKLGRAWTTQRDKHVDDLVDVIDRMVQVRTSDAQAAGHDSVLARTLTKCDVTENEVASVLEAFMTEATARYAGLEEEVRAALGLAGDVPPDLPADFPYFMQRLRRGQTPILVLDDCLNFIWRVAERIFGLSIQPQPSDSEHVITVSISSADTEVGQINFDLWETHGASAPANYTRGLRNRTEWRDIVQVPVAYVSCRFSRDHGENRINFQNVHSLFHEFGHALNHVLISKRIPNRSGLEYLPLERLEYLSMWSEKWIYHDDFGAALGLDDERAGTIVARRLKGMEYRRTYLERALCALLDFEIHRYPGVGFQQAWDDLDARFGVSRFATIGDVVEYFTWPMYQTHPGANFTYVWGSADSCTKATLFSAQRLAPLPGELPGDVDTETVFAPSFRFDVRGPLPDPQSTFEFYDAVATDTAGTA
jgi:oligopeptidase A